MTMLVPKVSTRTRHLFQTLDAFFANNRPASFIFSVDNAAGGRFTSPNGFAYEIPALTFVDAQQRPLNGALQVRCQEIFDKRSLFYYGCVTATDRHLLDMECCLDFQVAHRSTTSIQLAHAIRVLLPFGKNSRWLEQSVYEKRTAQTHLLEGGQTQVWARTSVPVMLQKSGLQRRAYVHLFYPGAYLIGERLKRSNKWKQRAMISVVPDLEGPAMANIQAYLIFHESDSIVRLAPQRGQFSAFHLPKDKKASLILLGLERGQFYFYRTFLGPLDNQRIACRLEPVDNHQLQTELQRMIF